MTQPCQDSQPQEEGGRLPATKSCTSGVGELFKFHPWEKNVGKIMMLECRNIIYIYIPNIPIYFIYAYIS